jgi:hypothetical protein
MRSLIPRRQGCRKSVQLALGLLGLLMFVTLPIQRAHQLRVHYRTEPVRRTLERHSEVAQSVPAAPDLVVKEAWRPATIWFLEPEVATPPPAIYEFADYFPVPISRLLSRLKLGRRSSNGQDPLLNLA